MRRITILGCTATALLTAACGSNTSPVTEPMAHAATAERASRIASAREAIERADIASVDPESLELAEIDQMLSPGPQCAFAYTAHSPPVVAVRAAADGAGTPTGVVKFHGRLVELRAREAGGFQSMVDGLTLVADGVALGIRPLGESEASGEAPSEGQAELVFQLEQGLRVGYRGTYRCDRPA